MPLYGRLQQNRNPVASSSALTISGGNPCGYVGIARGGTTPISSQCPVVDSLPGPSGRRRPCTPGSDAGATPRIGTIDPNPNRDSVGNRSPPTCSARCTSVFEPASPYAAASGSSPIPQASSTTTAARRIRPPPAASVLLADGYTIFPAKVIDCRHW